MDPKSDTRYSVIILLFLYSWVLAGDREAPSVFESIRVEGNELLIDLRVDAGFRSWVFPDTLPLSPHTIEAGQSLRFPLSVAVQLYERHHGVKLIPLTNLAGSIGYELEFYQDARSAGGNLNIVRKKALPGGETNGVRVLELQDDAVRSGSGFKGNNDTSLSSAPSTNFFHDNRKTNVPTEMRAFSETGLRAETIPRTSTSLSNGAHNRVRIIALLGLLLSAAAALLFHRWKRRKP